MERKKPRHLQKVIQTKKKTVYETFWQTRFTDITNAENVLMKRPSLLNAATIIQIQA